VIQPGGKLILTTPSADIRLNPPFLTEWISRKWGHIYRLGYTREQLQTFFEAGLQVNVETWNASLYRFLYPFLRVLSIAFPGIVRQWVRVVARWDFRHLEGTKGFLFLEGLKLQEGSRRKISD
jgi:hypothetical protein